MVVLFLFADLSTRCLVEMTEKGLVEMTLMSFRAERSFPVISSGARRAKSRNLNVVGD